jgi:hypothetical protein
LYQNGELKNQNLVLKNQNLSPVKSLSFDFYSILGFLTLLSHAASYSNRLLQMGYNRDRIGEGVAYYDLV